MTEKTCLSRRRHHRIPYLFAYSIFANTPLISRKQTLEFNSLNWQQRNPNKICSRWTSLQPGYLSRREILIALGGIIADNILRSDSSNAKQVEGSEKDIPTVGYVTASGLRYFEFNKGDGRTPKWGDFVQFHYTLYTIGRDENTMIKGDSTYDRKKPYLIHHGNGTTIPGIEEALHTMRVGGRRRIIVPAKLGYVQDGLGPVPPPEWKRRAIAKRLSSGAGILVFDLEVTKIMPDPYDRGYYTDLTPTPDELVKMFDEFEREALEQKATTTSS